MPTEPKPPLNKFERLAKLRDAWAPPATKECPGTIATEAGSYPCSWPVPLEAANCPCCGHAFEQRH